MAAEIEYLRQQLETERIRLAACGCVAMANTPESAAKTREMLPQYRSASCDDVAAAVDREMALRQQLSEALAAIKMKDDALRAANHSCVEDWPLLREAFAVQPDDSALKAWIGEPVAIMGSHGHPKHISYIPGIQEEKLYGPWIPLYAPKGMTK